MYSLLLGGEKRIYVRAQEFRYFSSFGILYNVLGARLLDTMLKMSKGNRLYERNAPDSVIPHHMHRRRRARDRYEHLSHLRRKISERTVQRRHAPVFCMHARIPYEGMAKDGDEKAHTFSEKNAHMHNMQGERLHGE